MSLRPKALIKKSSLKTDWSCRVGIVSLLWASKMATARKRSKRETLDYGSLNS